MTNDSPRRLGRPPVLSEAERIDAILDAAARTFTECGYAATTMDRIAGRAQMSKRSLYRHFGDKMEIFRALLSRCGARAAIARLSPRAVDCRDPGGCLKTWLLELADFVMREEQVHLFRLAIAESSANTDVSRAFYDEALGSLLDALAERIAGMQAEGLVRAADPVALAEILLGSAFGSSAFREVMQQGTITAPPLAEVAARVDLMLALIGPALFPRPPGG